MTTARGMVWKKRLDTGFRRDMMVAEGKDISKRVGEVVR
jgi:hypothetical protein